VELLEVVDPPELVLEELVAPLLEVVLEELVAPLLELADAQPAVFTAPPSLHV
jgi:hypothetical protein